MTIEDAEPSNSDTGAAGPSQNMRPVRIAFCTKWRLAEKYVLEIDDELESLEVPYFPFSIDEGQPLYAAVFWQGNVAVTRATLTVVTPTGKTLRVKLPALKPFYWDQVQMNSLRSFCFVRDGEYQFAVETENDRITRSLRVVAGSPISIDED